MMLLRKSTNPLLSFLAVFGFSIFTALEVKAQTYTWDANGATAGQTDGAGAWLNANQWWDGTTNQTWVSGANAVFGYGGAGGAVSLASPTTVGSLTFNYFTGTYTLGTISQTLTINNGLTVNAGTGSVTFISPIKLGAAQTWTNNSTGTVTVNDGTNSVTDTNGFTLTFKGGGASLGKFNIVRGNGVTGSGGIVVDNAYLDLRGGGVQSTNNYTGTTTVQNGGAILYFSNNIGTGNINLNGGTIEGYFNEGFTRPFGTGNGQFQITGGVSGFGVNGTNTINFSNITEVQWGSASFNPSKFVLGGGVNGGTVTFAEGIDLNGANRTVMSNVGGVLSALVRNTSGTAAGLIKEGPGTVSLTFANTYNGATTVSAGNLTLSGSGTILSTTGINLNTGTLQLTNTAQVSRVPTVAIGVTAGGGITYTNTSGANVYTQSVGATTLNSGQFNVVLSTDQVSTGSQALTFGSLSQSGTSAVTFSASGTSPNTTKNMIAVTGAGTTNANEIIGPWATTGTSANAQTDYAVYNSNFVTSAGIAASAQSAWTTTTAATSNYTMTSSASGTISGGTKNINSLRSFSLVVTVTASNANIELVGHSLAVGDVVTFSAATMPTGLTAGTPYYVVSAVAGTSFQVSATSGGTAITPTTAGSLVAAGGAIQVSSGNNLGSTGILNASATLLNILQVGGAGVVTLPTTSAGTLYVNTGSGGITINAPVTNNTGALTLAKNGSAGTLILNGVNTFTGDLAINAGTLQIGTNAVANGANLNSGNYAGNIFIGNSATLSVQTNSNQTLSGIISGDGALVKSYSGTLTLGNSNTYTGKTSITPFTASGGGGTLIVSSFNSVVGGTASSSLGAPTTVANGTIDLGNGSVQSALTLQYSGAAATGETTDRVLNFAFNGNSSRTIDASGSGLLKFTSAPTSNGTATNSITLQGSSNGEFVGGLPFAFTNLTKSGAGTWTLGGSVGNTGITTVSTNGGTLALQQRSSLLGGANTNWTAAKVVVNSGSTLAFNVGGAGEFNTNDITTILTNLGGLGGAVSNNGLRSGSTIGFNTTNAAGGIYTVANSISNSTGTGGGAISVAKLGTNTLVLLGANNYTGITSINAGTLVVNGAHINGSAYNVNGGTLAGSGTVSGLVTVAANATLTGGDPTSVTMNALSPLNGFATTTNSRIAVRLFTDVPDNTSTTPTSNSFLNVFSGTTTIDPGTVFVLSGTPVSPLNGGSSYSYRIATGVSPQSWTTLNNQTQFNATALTGGTQFTFSVTMSGTDLFLNLAPVPEPASIGLMALAGLAFCRGIRRRTRG